MNSCLYAGQVRHRRFTPSPHEFKYSLFYVYLDLDEVNTIFRGIPFWSAKRFAPAWFRQEDHFGKQDQGLKERIQALVSDRIGIDFSGKVCLLTHFRYFGYLFNPVSFYYCFNHKQQLSAIVAEVNNTPWGEQHLYVMPVTHSDSVHKVTIKKDFHVSPFMPMDIIYHWHINTPGAAISIHMENYNNNEKVFDATLGLKQQPFTAKLAVVSLIKYPLLTLKVTLSIYWEALRLFIKRTPLYTHPDKLHTQTTQTKEAKSS